MIATRLTNVEIIQISKLLDTVLTKEEAGVRYTKPWSDARVAKKFGVKNTHIRYLRVQAYGQLAEKPKPKQIPLEPKDTLRNKVQDLHNLTLAHTEMIDRLTARLAYLERELGVTREDNSAK